MKNARRRAGTKVGTHGERAHARKMRRLYGPFGQVPQHLRETMQIGTAWGLTKQEIENYLTNKGA